MYMRIDFEAWTVDRLTPPIPNSTVYHVDRRVIVHSEQAYVATDETRIEHGE